MCCKNYSFTKTKRMKKTIYLLSLFFVLIFNKTVYAQSQSVYIHDFHIKQSGNLTTSEQAQIDKTITKIKEYLKATLKGDYEILPDKASNMLSTELDGMKVSYHEEADYMVFGTILYDRDSEYLIVSTQRYEVLNKDYLKRKDIHTAEANISVWNEMESRLEKIDEILKNIFPNLRKGKNEAEKQRKDELEEEKIRIAAQKEQERIAKQQKLEEEEEKRRIAAEEKKDRIAKEKELEEEKIRIAVQKEQEQIERKKEEEKCVKKEKRENMLKNIPGIGMMVGGVVMGGKGIQLRMKALNLHDEYEGVLYNETEAELDVKLGVARKPNRWAHIIGVGGLLAGSIGTYMLLKRKKNKKSSNSATTRLQQIKIEPHIEYNIGSNNNTFHAKMSYTF